MTEARVWVGGPPVAAHPGTWRRWCACGVRIIRATLRRDPGYRLIQGWVTVTHSPCGCVWEGPGGDQLNRQGLIPGPWRRWVDGPHPARRFLAGYDPAHDHRRSDDEPRIVVVTNDGTLLSEDDQGRLVPRGHVSSVEIRGASPPYTYRYGPLGADEVRDEVRHDLYVRLHTAGPEDGPAEVIAGEGYANQAMTFGSPTETHGELAWLPSGQREWLFTQAALIVEEEGGPGEPWLRRSLWDAAGEAAGRAEASLFQPPDPEDLSGIPDYDHEEARRRLAEVDKILAQSATWEDQAHRYSTPREDEPPW